MIEHMPHKLTVLEAQADFTVPRTICLKIFYVVWISGKLIFPKSWLLQDQTLAQQQVREFD
jgi:hypothetical protein